MPQMTIRCRYTCKGEWHTAFKRGLWDSAIKCKHHNCTGVTGEIPNTISCLASLNKLALSNCGAIRLTVALNNLTALQSLDLSGTHVSCLGAKPRLNSLKLLHLR